MNIMVLLFLLLSIACGALATVFVVIPMVLTISEKLKWNIIKAVALVLAVILMLAFPVAVTI